MPILLPNLDDRVWSDLVEEGRALIPLYAPEWTDQNVSDPGITLMELLASIAEMDIFELNRISDRARLKFLALVGIRPKPPVAACTMLSFRLASGAGLVALPAGVIFAGQDPFGVSTPFRTLEALDILPAQLAAVQTQDSTGFRDLTDRWNRGLSFGIFGDAPAPGAQLYLGFDAPLAAGQAISLFFIFTGGRSGADERRRILAEAAARQQACTPVVPVCSGATAQAPQPCDNAIALPPFLGVRTTWEILTAGGWVTIPPNAIADDTRQFTLDGRVVLTPPQNSAPQALGRVSAPQSYLRATFAAGAYDAPPTAQSIVMNAVAAGQSALAATLTWTIAAGVTASPAQPPAALTGLVLAFDTNGNISALSFVTGSGLPLFHVLAFTAATASAAGSLTVEAALLGIGDGTPAQQMQLPQVPIDQASLALFSYENSGWQPWRLRPDLDASRRADRDFLLDATSGVVTFGNGEHGMTAPPGVPLIARYRATRADAGNLAAGVVNTLVDSPHNRAVLADFAAVQAQVAVNNPVAAAGGTAAETLGAAIGRTIAMLAAPERAVTLEDYETLALNTPGTAVARAKAWANLHPSFPCLEAPGMITLVILPDMPGPQPVPGSALLATVAAYLNRRRIIGSRLAVVGPQYREIAVQAQVKALPGTSKTALQKRVVDALNQFFDPLTGGPDGTGWPFGRDVYRTEVMQVIDKVAGVDYIASFDLLADGCTCAPQCGNVCLAPGALVDAGQHQIEVL
jgi:predicted phage baseplate assembly protein